MCSKESIVYKAECTLCSEQQIIDNVADPVEKVYIGETSRTLYYRANQHKDDCKKMINNWRTGKTRKTDNQDDGSSWMYDHLVDDHSDKLADNDVIRKFKFTVLANHKDALTRQIHEAVLINNCIDKNILEPGPNPSKISSLNRKGEHFAARIRWRNF